jgi:hypothetical protein
METPIEKKRCWRPWQFSLRAMLLLMSVAAVWLGVVTHRAREQKQAVEAIRSAGGEAYCEHEIRLGNEKAGLPPSAHERFAPAPRWLRNWLGDDYVADVTSVYFAIATDADMKHVGRLTHLKHLDLSQARALSDSGIAHIARLEHLEELKLDNTGITDGALAYLGGLTRLRHLRLSGTAIDGSGLEYLRGLQDLEVLELQETKITDDSLANVAQLANLRHLWLCGTPIGDAGLKQLAILKNLEWLHLNETRITGRGLAAISGLTGLRQLSLANTAVDDAGLQHLAQMHELEGLDLSGCDVTGVGLRHLSGIKLTSLVLDRTRISDGVMLVIASLQVEELWIRETKVTADGILQLTTMPTLRAIVHRRNRISLADYFRLEKEMPRVRISLDGLP